MESNKLIAEFLGLSYDSKTKEYYRPLYNSGDWISENELEYHNDWNWLMDVVHKCFEVALDGDMWDIMHFLQVADRDNTYIAVVEFINEYNRTDGSNETN